VSSPAVRHELPVLSLGFADVDAPPRLDFAPVSAFFASVGTGVAVEPVWLGQVRLPKRIAFYAQNGGMGRPPQNSQAVAEEAVHAVGTEARALLSERLLLVAPPPFWPHTWRLLRGGVHLGERKFCVRYSIVPSGATVGAVSHELGHLLFDWPDWDRDTGVKEECLMGTGGYRHDGADPVAPCAPLLMSAGLARAFELDARTPLGDLAPGVVATFVYRGRSLLFEWRHDIERLVAYQLGPSPLESRLALRIRTTEKDAVRPVLALAADSLFRIAQHDLERDISDCVSLPRRGTS